MVEGSEVGRKLVTLDVQLLTLCLVGPRAVANRLAPTRSEDRKVRTRVSEKISDGTSDYRCLTARYRIYLEKLVLMT